MSRRSESTQTLSEMQMDLTRQLILDTALEVLESSLVSDLTVRGVAKRARISERTVFRYFADRERFLDAIAEEAKARMEVPRPPETVEELYRYPAILFNAFESKAKLIRSTLQSEIMTRVRGTQGGERWASVRRLIDQYAPGVPEPTRKIAAANIQYFLTALSWNYHRTFFKFSQEETIACAELAIRDTLRGLKK